MTIKETIRMIRDKTETFRFYIFRFLRLFIFYRVYLAIIETCSSISYQQVGDPESINYNPLMHHGSLAFSIILLFIFLAGIFILYDPTARRRFAKNPPEEKHLYSEWLHVLLTYEFWAEIVFLAVFPLIWKTDIFLHPLWILFRRDDFNEMQTYLLYLAIILPIFFVIEMISRVKTRRFWRDLNTEDALDMGFDALKLVGLSILLIFGYPFLSQFYSFTLILIIAAAFLPSTLIGIAILMILLWIFSLFRAFRIRRKFLRKLKKFCLKEKIEISKISRPYLSLLLRKNHDFHFTVKRGGKTYACKMIAAKSKNAQMVFLDEDMGYFKYSFSFRGKETVFLRLKFYHSFEAENADKKVYIISPVPREIRAVSTHVSFQTEKTQFITESKRFRTLDNASLLYDSILFSGEGFLGALERDCLDRGAL